MKHVQILNGVVAAVIDVPEDLTITEMFHLDIAATIVEAGDEVEPGWHFANGLFTPPSGPSFEDRKVALVQAIDAKRDAVIAGGYQHNFGGSAGVRRLDNRNEADAINWLGLKGIVDSLISTGEASQKVGIVSADNSVFEASAETVSSALVSMAVWRSRIVLHARALKNAASDAATEADLDAIAVDAGWQP